MTGTTVEEERRVRDGFGDKVPKSIDEFAKRYRESDIHERMRAELDEHLSNMDKIDQDTQKTKGSMQLEKHSGPLMIKREPHTRGMWAQIVIALRREILQRWGDQWTFWARQATTFIQAWFVGSLFYAMGQTTDAIVHLLRFRLASPLCARLADAFLRFTVPSWRSVVPFFALSLAHLAVGNNGRFRGKRGSG